MKPLRHKQIPLDPISLVQSQLRSWGLDKDISLFISFLILVLAVSLLCWLANFIARRYLASFLDIAATKAHPTWGRSLQKHGLTRRLALLAPALVIYFCAPAFIITGVKATASFASVILLLNSIYTTIIVGLSLNALLSIIEDIYNTYSVSSRAPVKSYVQTTRLLLFMCVGIVVLSIILDLSPWTFLTGLGAATAVILLIFRDVLLGFVASIHISSYDTVRIGDWIEMSQYGIDGNVTEISLATVKVRNFDKTITTIPTYALISSGVKNWRGMRESGGRRIKRSISISMRSIRFCDIGLLEELRPISLIKDEVEVLLKNFSKTGDKWLINEAGTTNMSLFRKYVHAYLKKNKSLHKHGFDFIVRELQPGDGGLPLEIYVFSSHLDLESYEALQSEIFDHIIASLKYFQLDVFQKL